MHGCVCSSSAIYFVLVVVGIMRSFHVLVAVVVVDGALWLWGGVKGQCCRLMVFDVIRATMNVVNSRPFTSERSLATP